MPQYLAEDVYDLINKVINGKYNSMLDTADSYRFDLTHFESDKKVIKLLKYIVNDYHANCEKSVYYTDANERTPMLRIYHTDIQIIQRHVQEPLVHVVSKRTSIGFTTFGF